MNPLHRTPKATSEDFISTPVECTVFQRLKLLRRLQEVKLSPDEAWALLAIEGTFEDFIAFLRHIYDTFPVLL